MPGETVLERRPVRTDVDPGRRDLPAGLPPQEEHAYYDISMLKQPTWKTEVASYFFLGGLSAGAYLVSRMADRFGGERLRPVTRAGTAVAAVTVVPCAPLLIADLGDPKRFHHMLRVWKPSSPMNLGAWTLTAYSGAVAAAVLREWLLDRPDDGERGMLGRLTDAALLAVTDAAGVPVALLLAGYTGVLLSATSTPVWSKNPWLGPMFSASALSTGAEAVRLVLGLTAALRGEPTGEADEALKKIDAFAHVAEALTAAGFGAAAGSLAKPLTSGQAALPFWGAALGLMAGEVLNHLPLSGRAKRWSGILASLAGLAGGYALRWAIVHAGPPSANDPRAAREASRRARR